MEQGQAHSKYSQHMLPTLTLVGDTFPLPLIACPIPDTGVSLSNHLSGTRRPTVVVPAKAGIQRGECYPANTNEVSWHHAQRSSGISFSHAHCVWILWPL